jgi:hypothetical protein
MTRNLPRTIDKKTAKARHDTTPDRGARERLLATLPVAERRLRLNGVCTAVLEGGQGLPIVRLHGLGEYAAKMAARKSGSRSHASCGRSRPAGLRRLGGDQGPIRRGTRGVDIVLA